MMPRRIARWTIGICLLAAVVEAALACTSTPKMSLADTPIVLFLVGPYLLLAVVAWRTRGRRTESWALLVFAVGLSIAGVALFGEDSYRYHTDPNHRRVQRMTVFLVPLGQWAIVATVAFCAALLKRGSPSASPRS